MATSVPATNPPGRFRQRLVLVLLLAVGTPVGASVLYSNSPVERVGLARFFPGCAFQSVTGFHCPGCGATRSLYSLLHADLPQAWAWNPLFVLAAPFLLYACWRIAFSMWTGKRAPGPSVGMRGAILLGVILVAYWVVRNVPIEPFNPLAPHLLARHAPPAPPPTPTP